MAANGSVRVEGLNKTLTALQRLGADVNDLKDTMAGIAAEGARLASGFAPTRTGRLRASIKGNRAKARAVVSAGKARVPYAGAVNYGWPKGATAWQAKPRRSGGWPVGIKASLFMQRADAALAPRAVSMLEDGLDKAVRRAGLQ